MNKKYLMFLLPLLLLSSGYSWWNDSFYERQAINVTHDNAITEYSILINVDYDSSMQPDFDDLRFIDSDDLTELPYYLQTKTNTVNASFWVKLDVANGNKTVYLYYDNPSVSSNSDFNTAFSYADDFNDNSINVSLWNEEEFNGSINETGGKLNMTCDVNVNNSCSTILDSVGSRSAPVLWLSLNESYDYEIYVEITKDNWLGSGGFGRRESNGFWISNGGINDVMYNWNGSTILPTWYNVSAVYQAFFIYYNKTYLHDNDNTEPFNWIAGGYQNSTSCLVMRIFGGGNVTAYSGNTTNDCQTNVNFSPLILDKINYYYDNAWNETGLWLEGDYTGGDVNGIVSVEFDNFRVRKLDSNIDGLQTYLSDEPLTTFSGFSETTRVTEQEQDYANLTYFGGQVSGFFSAISVGLPDLLIGLAIVSIIVGFIFALRIGITKLL